MLKKIYFVVEIENIISIKLKYSEEKKLVSLA